jgi:hypothetical protein
MAGGWTRDGGVQVESLPKKLRRSQNPLIIKR